MSVHIPMLSNGKTGWRQRRNDKPLATQRSRKIASFSHNTFIIPHSLLLPTEKAQPTPFRHDRHRERIQPRVFLRRMSCSSCPPRRNRLIIVATYSDNNRLSICLNSSDRTTQCFHMRVFERIYQIIMWARMLRLPVCLRWTRRDNQSFSTVSFG